MNYHDLDNDTSLLDKIFNEDVADVADQKPESDNFLRDSFQDFNRNFGDVKQKVKKVGQNAKDTGKAATKQFNSLLKRVKMMMSQAATNKAAKEKEEMLNPNATKKVFKIIFNFIKNGAYLKAGLLFNPIFMTIRILGKIGKSKRQRQLRNELIYETQKEIEITQRKIEYARAHKDIEDETELMRFKGELERKLLRAQGGKLKKMA